MQQINNFDTITYDNWINLINNNNSVGVQNYYNYILSEVQNNQNDALSNFQNNYNSFVGSNQSNFDYVIKSIDYLNNVVMNGPFIFEFPNNVNTQYFG